MEQLAPHLAHALLDALGDLRGGIHRVDPVILQIPADILRLLGRECEGKRPSLGLAWAVAFQRRFHLPGAVSDSQSWHLVAGECSIRNVTVDGGEDPFRETRSGDRERMPVRTPAWQPERLRYGAAWYHGKRRFPLPNGLAIRIGNGHQ